MTDSTTVYRIDASVEEDRPCIDFDSVENRVIDWFAIGEILRGHRDIANYHEVHISLPELKCESWGCVMAAGPLGLISASAVACIGQAALSLFALLPATINGQRYYFAKPVQFPHYLNESQSLIRYFASNSSRIKSIERYCFFKDRIIDPIVFCLPELPHSEAFATSRVRDSILTSGLQGFCFTPLD